MIKILFFASLRELFKCEKLNITLDEDKYQTIDQLVLYLIKNKKGPWLEFKKRRKQIRVAINQQVVSWESKIKQGDEIAFLPPITGG